jgi:hypothetical protein
VLLLPAEAASQVFIQLVVSTSMMVALANSNPYIHDSDDLLAQLCQIALTFTMSVGLLEMAARDFQDAYFGPTLIACTTIQLIFGFIVAFVQWTKEKMPNTVKKFEAFYSIWSGPDDSELIAPRQIRASILQADRSNRNRAGSDGNSGRSRSGSGSKGNSGRNRSGSGGRNTAVVTPWLKALGEDTINEAKALAEDKMNEVKSFTEDRMNEAKSLAEDKVNEAKALGIGNRPRTSGGVDAGGDVTQPLCLLSLY